MAGRWSAFNAAVRHSLDGWPALHIAQQQGFGGDNFKEKLEWLLEVIIQIFHENEHVYQDELQEYISECLYNEFDIIVDDGTCPKVVEKICNFNQLCLTGQYSKVFEELRVPPPTCPPVQISANDDLSDEECQDAAQPVQNLNTDANAIDDSTQDQAGSSSQTNMDSMDLDECAPMDDNDDTDGWEVVRRSKQRNNSRKSK